MRNTDKTIARVVRWVAATALTFAAGIVGADPRLPVAANPMQVADGLAIDAPDQLGPWAVGRTTLTLTDPAREGRSLALDVWYPVDPEDAADAVPSSYDLVFAALESPNALDAPPGLSAGPRPLIVFSHGSFGIRFQSFFLTEALASHGFIVAAPDHTGNTAADLIFGTDVPFEQSALDRPQDLSFVIDEMLAKNADPEDGFFGRIDPARIGATGHSFGGFTTLAMASGYETVSSDPRVSVLAPFAPASGILLDEQLAAITLPTLILGGTADITTPIDPDSIRPWQLINGGPVVRTDITDAGHQSFTDICDLADALLASGIPQDLIDFLLGNVDEGCAPELIPIAEAQRITRLYVVAFMQRFLADEPRYRRYLSRRYANTNEPDVTFLRSVFPAPRD